MLDAVVDYLPSPLDIPPIIGLDPQKAEPTQIERPASDDAPFSALAFKIMTDPFVGQLCFIRVYSGVMTSGSTIYNATKQKNERAGRLQREFNVEATVGRPQVAYRETLTRSAEGEGRYIKQTGGRGQYGHAKIRLIPRKPGEGYEFVNEIVGGTIPKEFIKPIDQG